MTGLFGAAVVESLDEVVVVKLVNKAGSGGANEVEAEFKAGATIGKEGVLVVGKIELVLGANSEDVVVVGAAIFAVVELPNGRLNKLPLVPVAPVLPNRPVFEVAGVLPKS